MDLKLRAWDRRENKWLDPDLLIFTNWDVYKDYRYFENDVGLIDYDLMLNTGIIDRHGQEIFSGDILKIFPITSFCEVVFKPPAFYLRWLSQKLKDLRGEYEVMDAHLTYEICGNRYDNFDLLGE